MSASADRVVRESGASARAGGHRAAWAAAPAFGRSHRSEPGAPPELGACRRGGHVLPRPAAGRNDANAEDFERAVSRAIELARKVAGLHR
jgi:hypothetical protein